MKEIIRKQLSKCGFVRHNALVDGKYSEDDFDIEDHWCDDGCDFDVVMGDGSRNCIKVKGNEYHIDFWVMEYGEAVDVSSLTNQSDDDWFIDTVGLVVKLMLSVLNGNKEMSEEIAEELSDRADDVPEIFREKYLDEICWILSTVDSL